jgi:hypothetical protein
MYGQPYGYAAGYAPSVAMVPYASGLRQADPGCKVAFWALPSGGDVPPEVKAVALRILGSQAPLGTAHVTWIAGSGDGPYAGAHQWRFWVETHGPNEQNPVPHRGVGVRVFVEVPCDAVTAGAGLYPAGHASGQDAPAKEFSYHLSPAQLDDEIRAHAAMQEAIQTLLRVGVRPRWILQSANRFLFVALHGPISPTNPFTPIYTAYDATDVSAYPQEAGVPGGYGRAMQGAAAGYWPQ